MARSTPNKSSKERNIPRQTLRIDELVAGGMGIARTKDGPVFVPRVASGELVEVEVSRHAGAMRGNLLRVLEPSAERVEPPCDQTHRCGGCDFMHLSAAAQQHAHVRTVGHALSRAFPGVTLPEIQMARTTELLNYRTRARLFVVARAGKAPKVEVGYREAQTHSIVVPGRCWVLTPALEEARNSLADVLVGASGKGDVQIALGAAGLPVLSIAWTGELPASFWAAVDRRINRRLWSGVSVSVLGARTPASFGDPRPRMLGADGCEVVLAAGGFAQPSDEGARLLASCVDSMAKEAGGSGRVVELFAGSGTLSVLLARGAASYEGVEQDAEAVRCARENLEKRGISGKIVASAVDGYVIRPRADVLVLDPPRTGALEAMKAIALSRPKSIVYVSCDPNTLGRDLAALQSGAPSGRWGPTAVTGVELFPQTHHVETVVRLSRTGAA